MLEVRYFYLNISINFSINKNIIPVFSIAVVWIVSRYRVFRPEVMFRAQLKLRQMGLDRHDWHYNKSEFC